MRKREIHSVAHWAMMFILLMFPLLMVVVGAFQNADYQPQVVSTKLSDINQLYGNTYYQFKNETFINGSSTTGTLSLNVSDIVNNTDTRDLSSANKINIYYYNSNTYFSFYNGNTLLRGYDLNTSVIDFDFYLLNYSNTNSDVSLFISSFYKIEYIDNYHYKNDVNLWTKSFLDLPINSWYKSLMNVIGVGFTNSSVMNVIYVMPVYILWVFIFDVIVDCFLVIIKLPHKLLNRLSGGENE